MIGEGWHRGFPPNSGMYLDWSGRVKAWMRLPEPPPRQWRISDIGETTSASAQQPSPLKSQASGGAPRPEPGHSETGTAETTSPLMWTDTGETT